MTFCFITPDDVTPVAKIESVDTINDIEVYTGYSAQNGYYDIGTKKFVIKFRFKTVLLIMLINNLDIRY